MVAKVRKRLAASNEATLKFDTERFNLKKINEVQGKEQCHVKISNMLAALENLEDDVHIHRAWETTRGNYLRQYTATALHNNSNKKNPQLPHCR
jgi:hypothetical protein